MPADEATITAYVYTYDRATGAYNNVAGQTVYLYTENGARTGVTNVDGCCTFTVDATGKTRMDYLLATTGVSGLVNTWIGFTPLDLDNPYSVRPGMITNEFAASAYVGALYPNTETRIADVIPDGDAYNVIARSYGPAGEPIHEKGFFTLNRRSAVSMWDSEATEDAAVVNFAGTESRRVIPEVEGDYEINYGLFNPNSKSIDRYLYTTFRNPERSVSYTMPDTVLVGTSVPITFTASTSDGAPIAGARVVLAAGAAGDTSWFSFNNDPRDANILLADWFPDPYTVFATGYTDANGKVTLTFTAPTAGQQALRESLARVSEIPYLVACYHNGELVQGDGGYLMVTAKLLPDFVPGVSAPHIVKLERDDSITLANVSLSIRNSGTADYVYAGTRMDCTAEVGSHSEVTYFEDSLGMGETKTILTTTVTRKADQFGINTSDYRLPLDVNVGIEVNSNRVVEELNYDNNRLAYPVRITAPDLAVEVIAPRYTTPTNTTVIGILVTNRGEVGSNAANLHYSITGKPEETRAIPALMPGKSTYVWFNQTLVTGEYTVNAEVNRGGLTDYETTFANNRANATIGSYTNPATKIELPGDLVLVPGTTYDLPITVNQVSKLAAANIDLTFNGSVLEVKGVTAGALPLFGQPNIESGRVRFESVSVSGVSGDVTIATIQFRVTGKTGDKTALNLVAGLTDDNVLPIPIETTSGSAYLLLYGDANSDGRVDQADTLLVLKQVVGLERRPEDPGSEQFRRTDVTRNKAIDVGDAMFIAQKNVGLRDAYFKII